MLIYTNTDPPDEYTRGLTVPHELTNSVADYINSVDPCKIAVYQDGQEDSRPEFHEQRLTLLRPASQLVVMIYTELMTPDSVHQFFKPNTHFILPGYLNSPPVQNHCICSPHFINQIKHHYELMPETLEELTPYKVKPWFFDALLGQRKPHRDFIHNLYVKHGLQDKIMMSYRADAAINAWDHMGTDNKDFIWEPGIELEPGQTARYNSQIVAYHGQQISLSFIVPIHSVYNQTAYSIVAETAFPPNPDVFFTEKIAKPLISRRLFVVFTGRGYLQGLRRLGFKTFDGVIDESYDTIEDDEQRWQAAFEQVRWLCEQHQTEIFNKIKPIVEHNYQVLTQTNWLDLPRRDLANLILTKIGN